MNLAQSIINFLGVKRAIRMMESSSNPQAFRGEPKPKPQAGKQSNRQKIDRMLSSMEPVPLPENPTEEDIAKHLGVSVQQLREVTGGRSVEQMATSLDTTPEELISVLESMLRQMTPPPAPGDTMSLRAAMGKLKAYGVGAMAATTKARQQRADALAGRGRVGQQRAEAIRQMNLKARKLRGG